MHHSNFDIFCPVPLLLREGAQRLIHDALEAEVDEYLEEHKHLMVGRGLRRLIRNGYVPERALETDLGKLNISVPRVRDRLQLCSQEKLKFSSKLLPAYLRRMDASSEMFGWFYFKGMATGNLSEALIALLGNRAVLLSSPVLSRLRSQWHEELKCWRERDLSGTKYRAFWIDSVNSDDRALSVVLFVAGLTVDGGWRLLSAISQLNDSEISWHELVVGLKFRRLRCDGEVSLLGPQASYLRTFCVAFGGSCSIRV